MFDPNLRKTKGFVYAILALGISQVGYLSLPFALSLYFQVGLQFSPMLAGFAIAPVSVALVVASPLSGRISDRLKSPAMLSTIGAAIVTVFMALLGFFYAQ